ncbi:hypothetical protein K5V07_08885 [Flavobacterium sp. CHNK8]|jgi:hypothetical protein|uniref:hypothetical protein n=1 Tax=Flavobacterium sp. CHNK8 TaxID=2871165 RepID=UPI001C8D0546|nr:hypothetical protein [Flavobacterium sp. CHNK8]QZK90599.1 hypothetical protein K5V07_08885 [Flavobacterium sp. CHNK8]
MRHIILTLLLTLISCGENEKKTNKNETTGNQKSIIKVQNFQIGQVYENSIFEFLNKPNVTYSIGKYKPYPEEEILIDSTLTENESHQIIMSVESGIGKNDEYINLKDYNLVVVNDNDTIKHLLLKYYTKEKSKLVDIFILGKHRENSNFIGDLEGNKFLCNSCYDKGTNEYFGIVIDKLDKNRKYEKVIKVWKLDLINEKFEEIDLKKEKIECLPED